MGKGDAGATTTVPAGAQDITINFSPTMNQAPNIHQAAAGGHSSNSNSNTSSNTNTNHLVNTNTNTNINSQSGHNGFYDYCFHGGFWGFYRRPSFIFCLYTVVSFACIIMLCIGLALPQWDIATFNGGVVNGTGELRVGVWKYCISSDDEKFDTVCHERTELTSICDDFADADLRSDCDTWIDRTWTVISSVVVALACLLVSDTIAFMTFFCIIGVGRGEWGALVALTVTSFLVWVCTVIAIAAHNIISYDFFEPIRDLVLTEDTPISPDVVWRDFEPSHSYNLVVASMVLMMFLFFACFYLVYTRSDTYYRYGWRMYRRPYDWWYGRPYPARSANRGYRNNNRRHRNRKRGRGGRGPLSHV